MVGRKLLGLGVTERECNALPSQNLLAAHVAGSHWKTSTLQMQKQHLDAPGPTTNKRLCALVEVRHENTLGDNAEN